MTVENFHLAFIIPGHYEWLILLILGLLIFGRRLPEVGRSVGRAIVEFKRGIKGIGDEIEDESSKSAPPPQPRVSHQPPHLAEAAESPAQAPSPAAEPVERVEARPAGGESDRG